MDGVAHVDFIESQFHFSGIDLGQVEDVIDQSQEMLTGIIDGRQVLLLLLVDRSVDPLENHTRKTDDRVEWCS